MRVRTTAKKASETMPGIVQTGLFPSRSQAQNVKHPAISPTAASKYQRTEFTQIPSGLTQDLGIGAGAQPFLALRLGSHSDHG